MGRQITIGNPPISIGVRTSARARRLSLRVSRIDGVASLTVPPHAKDRQIMAFLTDREDWLRSHVDQAAPQQPLKQGSLIPFEGRQIEITLADVARPVLQDNVLRLPTRRKSVSAQTKAFLKVAARTALASASDHYAAAIGRSYSKLTLRDTRSRWGSCTSAGGLMYSWRLIMAPPEVLSYVAAHEVAHLVEMNHSPAFWSLVADLMPDYEEHRAWLKREGAKLHQISFDD